MKTIRCARCHDEVGFPDEQTDEGIANGLLGQGWVKAKHAPAPWHCGACKGQTFDQERFRELYRALQAEAGLSSGTGYIEKECSVAFGKGRSFRLEDLSRGDFLWVLSELSKGVVISYDNLNALAWVRAILFQNCLFANMQVWQASFSAFVDLALAKFRNDVTGGSPFDTDVKRLRTVNAHLLRSAEAERMMVLIPLGFALLEGLLRRKNHKFVDTAGRVLQRWTVAGRVYDSGRCNRVEHLLELWQQRGVDSDAASALANFDQGLFSEIGKRRNELLHGQEYWLPIFGMVSSLVAFLVIEELDEAAFEAAKGRVNGLSENEADLHNRLMEYEKQRHRVGKGSGATKPYPDGTSVPYWPPDLRATERNGTRFQMMG